VENAIIHGMKPLGEGHIDIDIFREKENLAIVITDNGVGMDAAVKEKLSERMRSALSGSDGIGESGDSIGLINVHDRLRYSYGSPYGVSIESNPGRTAITLLLPFKLHRQGENDV